jgi:transposase-like protein
MPRPRKYPEELIQRGVRLAIESGRPVAHVAKDLGVPARGRPRSGAARTCRAVAGRAGAVESAAATSRSRQTSLILASRPALNNRGAHVQTSRRSGSSAQPAAHFCSLSRRAGPYHAPIEVDGELLLHVRDR